MTAETIPILDWRVFGADRPRFAAALGAACRGPGFFLLANPPVSSALRADIVACADRFFALPDAVKAETDIRKTPHYRGWAAEGLESLDQTRPETDRKESFNIGFDLAADDPRVVAGEPFRGVNQWPDLPGFRDSALEYYDAAMALGAALHQAVALDLGLAEDHFDRLFDAPMSVLRLLHYPPADGAPNAIGAGAHTDYGAITLLMTDGEPGLQVKPRGGDWTDAPHVEDAYVVNIGDCLMRWTNDLYVSTPHRVLPPKRRRRSVAMFVEANPDAIIEALPGTGAPKYPPIRAADYLMSRLDATYQPRPEGDPTS